MPAEQRVRFMVSYGEHLAELISAQDSPSGDLQIFVRRSTNLELGGRQEMQIEHEKFTVHLSPSSHGTTVTKTVEGDMKLRAASFVKNSKERLFWVLHGRACPDLTDKRYRKKPSKSDEIITVSASLDDARSFSYFIVVQLAGQPFQEIEGFARHSKAFAHFALGIYSTYLPVPSTFLGATVDPSTSDHTLDGVAVQNLGLSGEGADSYEEHQIEGRLIELTRMLYDMQSVRFRSGFPGRASEVPHSSFIVITPDPHAAGADFKLRLITR